MRVLIYTIFVISKLCGIWYTRRKECAKFIHAKCNTILQEIIIYWILFNRTIMVILKKVPAEWNPRVLKLLDPNPSRSNLGCLLKGRLRTIISSSWRGTCRKRVYRVKVRVIFVVTNIWFSNIHSRSVN